MTDRRPQVPVITQLNSCKKTGNDRAIGQRLDNDNEIIIFNPERTVI